MRNGRPSGRFERAQADPPLVIRAIYKGTTIKGKQPGGCNENRHNQGHTHHTTLTTMPLNFYHSLPFSVFPAPFTIFTILPFSCVLRPISRFYHSHHYRKVTVFRGDWELLFWEKKNGFRLRKGVFRGIFYTRGLKLCMGTDSRDKYDCPYSRALSNFINFIVNLIN